MMFSASQKKERVRGSIFRDTRRIVTAIALIAATGTPACRRFYDAYYGVPLSRNDTNHYSPPCEGAGHRRLWSLINFRDPKSVVLKEKPVGGRDLNANTSTATTFDLPALSPYNFDNIMLTSRAFNRELFVLYYDPQEDEFLIFIDEKRDPYLSKVYSPVWGRLKTVMPILTYALRNHFPDRFQGVHEFITYVSTGDVIKLNCECVVERERLSRPNYCQNDKFAPILQFGSVYKDSTILPSLVTMPSWPQLSCFEEWQKKGSICENLKLQRAESGKLGGDESLGRDAAAGGSKQMPFSEWDALIPTLIWRGSDYPFLTCIHDGVRPVQWARDIASQLARFGNNARGVVSALMAVWHILTPRWRVIALSAMAQLDAEEVIEADGNGMQLQQRHQFTWIDAKFTFKSKVHGAPVIEKVVLYEPFREFGIGVTSDEQMTLSQLSKYKYHIDLGGGGGTTWFGTLDKLGLPGLLFHHETSAKDYFHDELLPWVHYVPLSEVSFLHS